MEHRTLIRPLTADDCKAMARDMRAVDRRELAAMSGSDGGPDAAERELLRLMGRSRGRAMAGFHDGKLVNVFGVMVRTLAGRVGHPWMVATDEMVNPSVRRAFVRHCRPAFLACIPDGVEELWNLVLADNDAAIHWLKWLHFDFAPDSVVHEGAEWLRFEMRASHVL